MRLLNIESSPRGSKSASIAVTNAFLETYRQVCPGVMVDTLNVWEEKLPDFDQEAIGAKYKGVNKEPMDQAESAVWDKIQELAVRFQEADRILLGVSMWNFAYPYKLKQLIDLVCQRNMLFTYDGKEYGPLLKTPRAFAVYARGGTTQKTHRRPLPVRPSKRIRRFLAEVYRGQGGPYVGGGRHDVGRERKGRREHRAWSSRGKKVGDGFLISQTSPKVPVPGRPMALCRAAFVQVPVQRGPAHAEVLGDKRHFADPRGGFRPGEFCLVPRGDDDVSRCDRGQ